MRIFKAEGKTGRAYYVFSRRKNPGSCFSCTLPDCIDSGAPERVETDMLNEFIPDRMFHRTDKRRVEVIKMLADDWIERIERRGNK
jgi:hypothetical protein